MIANNLNREIGMETVNAFMGALDKEQLEIIVKVASSEVDPIELAQIRPALVIAMCAFVTLLYEERNK